MKTSAHDILKRILILVAVLAGTTPEPLLAQTPPARIWSGVHSRSPFKHTLFAPEQADTADVALYKKKHFWRASAETVGFNLGLWAFDRYVENGFYARISWNTIKENLTHGFEWDDDHLSTNMFAHPYMGNLYYNAGRSNGYNFWQSELFSIGGSAMWELFMECEYPSFNDIIATPVGGAALGEVFYRLSDLVTDDRATGWSRFGHEMVIFLFNPMRAFNRLVSGQSWQRRLTPGRRFGRPPLWMEVSAGMKALLINGDPKWNKLGGGARVYMEYGDRFAPEPGKPYDYFQILLELNMLKTQPVLDRIDIRGRLWAKEVLDQEDESFSIGFYQHFDYFDSDTITRHKPASRTRPCVVPYKFGTPACVGAGLLWRVVPHPKMQVNTYCHANAVAIGGILSDFYRYYHRNYNWASGLGLKAGVNFIFLKDRITLDIDDQFYYLATWEGYKGPEGWSLEMGGQPLNVQGDRGTAEFNHMEARLNVRLLKNLWGTVSADWYHRNTFYKDWYDFERYGIVTRNSRPFISSDQVLLNAMLTYRF